MRASTLTGAPQMIADLAVRALHDEADLTPKPGLVDGRGGRVFMLFKFRSMVRLGREFAEAGA